MAKLIRGNPDNLEGMVLVLGKCDKHDPPYLGFMASYAKKPIEELVERNCGKEHLNKIRQENARQPLDASSTPYHRFYCASKQKDLGIDGMDVVFAGEFGEEKDLLAVVDHSLRQYMIEYEEQSKKPILFLTEVNTRASYKDVAVEKLADYISKIYVEPLKHARKANDFAGAVKILAEIQFFSRESDFRHLIPEMCRLVTKEMDEKQNEILNLAIREIESVAKGEYEEAAKCRDAIILKKSKVLIS